MDGKLRAVTYGYPCAVHVDPVEKKPVYHFLPGTQTFSLATAGCNLSCKNCQNWQISQGPPDDVTAMPLPPADVIRLAREHRCPSISYTYTEPLVYYEYTLDTCRLAREVGLRNILVSAGYINAPPLRELFRFVDSARIDLKSMSNDFYRDVCGGEVAPVLRALALAVEMGLEVEVTHLIIPTLNDRDGELQTLSQWVRSNLGAEVPIHLLRFQPQYRMQHLPPTPLETLERAYRIARAEGLKHVYLGNVLEEKASATYCAGCGTCLIRRRGFSMQENHLKNGHCPKCGREAYGVWS